MKNRVLPALVLGVALVATSPVGADARPRDPDRTTIVAERAPFGGGPAQIVRVSPRTGQLRVVTSGNDDTNPDLSPSGRSIALQRCVDNCGSGASNVWTVHVDGSSARPLTDCDGTVCLGAFDPAFSPDGRYLAFAEDRLDGQGANVNGIFVMTADGRGQRRLTSRPDGTGPDGHPSFSPDGTAVVFDRETDQGGRLMVVGTDGSGLRDLVPGVEGYNPSWSPDGRRIAFTLVRRSGDQTTVDIATVDVAGRHLRRLTDEPVVPSAAFQPDWAPVGHQLVFGESESSTSCRLVLVNGGGRNRRALTSDQGCLFNPSWGTAAR